eukprot:754825-Pyramimonas_sp.AAC.1
MIIIIRLPQAVRTFGDPKVFRVPEFALHIGICAAYLARHCSDYARSSGGWVYFGDLVEKIAEDGFSYQ